MIEQASLVIGEGNWAVKSDSLLGYNINGGKYYPREMSVVRATTGTRINEDGLVELVPYNLLQYSEDFSNAAWTKLNTTYSENTLTAVGGLNSKYLYQAEATQGLQTIYFDVSYVSHQFLQIFHVSGATNVQFANFDIQNKVLGTSGGGAINSTIEDFGTFVRISLTLFTTTKTTCALAFVDSAAATRGASSASTGSIKIFSSQNQQGSTALDYLPTTDRLDIARIDYSSGSGALLVEPQRTNLLTYSSSFDNAAWGNPASVTANAVISPSGIQDADRVTGILSQLEAFTSGQAYTLSFYAKKNTSSSFAMRLDATANNTFTYNFDTETASSGATIEEFGDGWYYCTALVTANATATGVVYLNVNSDDFYLWGAQVELGNYSTSYIPTQAATVTRNADVISKTGIADLIGQTEGTLFIEMKDLVWTASALRLIGISDGTQQNRVILLTGQTSNTLRAITSTGNVLQNTTTAASTFGNVKIALTYSSAGGVVYVNGSQILSFGSISVPSCSALYIQTIEDGTSFPANGYTAAAAIWPTALTNAELATLTTI